MRGYDLKEGKYYLDECDRTIRYSYRMGNTYVFDEISQDDDGNEIVVNTIELIEREVMKLR